MLQYNLKQQQQQSFFETLDNMIIQMTVSLRKCLQSLVSFASDVST